MRNFVLKMSGLMASLALMVTMLNVNVACMCYAHQPELPEGSKKLRKF